MASAYTERMLYHAQQLYDELTEVLTCNGKGAIPISAELQNMLLSKMIDENLDELRYFVFQGNREDADGCLSGLRDLIEGIR